MHGFGAWSSRDVAREGRTQVFIFDIIWASDVFVFGVSTTCDP